MLSPEIISVERSDGTVLHVQLSKLPAIQGREILTQYVSTAMPKVGNYEHNATLMRKLLAYVCVVPDDGAPIPLTNDALINNHIGDWETLIKVEYRMIEYNTSFLKKHVTAGGLPQLLTMLKSNFLAALQNTN